MQELAEFSGSHLKQIIEELLYGLLVVEFKLGWREAADENCP